MKVFVKIAAGWLAIWGIGYIAGSFTAASFDLASWTYESRSLIALMASMGCAFVVPFAFALGEDGSGLR